MPFLSAEITKDKGMTEDLSRIKAVNKATRTAQGPGMDPGQVGGVCVCVCVCVCDFSPSFALKHVIRTSGDTFKRSIE